jgi:hypothetical protein
MRVLRIAALALAALVLPTLLVGITYVLSASSFARPAGAVVQVRRPIASPNPQQPRTERPKPKGDTQTEDVSGPCDEAEHVNDPRCTGVGSGDNSGHGSDDSGSDNSGSGSDNSGSDSSGSSGGDD